MPKYFPINAGANFDCVGSNLIAISWNGNQLLADFSVPEEGHALRVRFDGDTIVRLLDEMALSTEQGKKEGLVSRHFACRVENSIFADTQSEAWKVLYGPVSHYQFVTGEGCMDVLSHVGPSFEVVEIK